MALPSSVTVNPSSTTEALSGATSGFGGGLTFAFGGNPNLALLSANNGAGGLNLQTVGIIAAVAIVGLLLWKKR